jgi:hypothetical protein
MYKHTCANTACGKVFYHVRKDRKYCGTKCSSPANALKKKTSLLKKKEYSVWSCGGGVDSAAIAVLICQGKLPRPDYVVMTDNGYDASYTWDYVNQVLIPNLADVDVELHIICSQNYVDVEIVSSGQVVIPAYCQGKNEVVKLNTHCSGKWKVTPVKRWMKEQGDGRCINSIGIAADEARRAKESKLQWFQFRYPLCEFNLSRRDCKRLIEAAGWPIPLRSSCVMCPQHSDNQWLDLRDDYPEDFQRAVDIEREMHKTNPGVFLHRSLKSLDCVEFRGGGI